MAGLGISFPDVPLSSLDIGLLTGILRFILSVTWRVAFNDLSYSSMSDKCCYGFRSLAMYKVNQ